MSKPKRSWRWLWRLTLVGGCLLVILVSAYATAFGITGAQVRAAQGKLREQGMPVVAADLARELPPPEQNAAVLYNQALVLRSPDYVPGRDSGRVGRAAGIWTEVNDVHVEPTPRGGWAQGTPEQQARIRAVLTDPDVQQVFALLTAARDRPQCVFHEGPAPGDYGWQHVGGMRIFAWLLGEDAVVAALDGDRDRAVDRLLTLADMVGKCRQDSAPRPTEWQVVMPFRHVVRYVDLTADELAAMATGLAVLDPRACRRRVYRTVAVSDTERILRANVDNEIFSAFSAPPGQAVYGRDFAPRNNLDAVWFLRGCTRLDALFAVPYCVADVAGLKEFLDSLPPYAWHTRLRSRDWCAGIRHCAWAEAHVAVAQTGCALLRYHAAYGEFPATLDVLVPEFLPAVPMDPWTCQPVVYTPRADGWDVIVSPDGTFGADPSWHYPAAEETRQ